MKIFCDSCGARFDVDEHFVCPCCGDDYKDNAAFKERQEYEEELEETLDDECLDLEEVDSSKDSYEYDYDYDKELNFIEKLIYSVTESISPYMCTVVIAAIMIIALIMVGSMLLCVAISYKDCENCRVGFVIKLFI